MEQKLTFGIFGGGRIGKMHAENLLFSVPEVRLKTVADPFADNLTDWARSVGLPELTKDHREIIDDPEIDAVIICSPTGTHADYIIESARAGKHVLCEKPISFDVKKTKEALKIVEKAGVKLQVGFNRRFDSNAQKIHNAVAKSHIGDVHIVRITSRDPAPPPYSYIESSGGIFVDMMIHDFDMARFISMSEVTEVYASGAVLIDPSFEKAGDVDTALVMLKFANGAIGVIDNSRQAVYGYDQRMEVFGSKGSIEGDNKTEAQITVRNESGIIGEKPHWFFIERYFEAYLEEVREFCTAILEDKPVLVDGMDGLKPVIIGLAATESLKTGKPVKVADFEKRFD